MSMLGINASAWSGMVAGAFRDELGVEIAAEMTSVIRALDGFRDHVGSQVLLDIMLKTLADSSVELPSDIVSRKDAIAARAIELRGMDPQEAKRVDDAMATMLERIASESDDE
jgi:hypothetical protein